MRRDEIRRLHEQRAHLHAEAAAIVHTAEDEDRELTAEEQTEFDRIQDEYASTETRARNAEQLYMQEREVEKALNAPIETRIGDDDDAPTTLKEYRARMNGVRPWDEPEVRSAYFRYLTVQHISELDVEEQRALSKASGAVGAFLVPTDFYDQIIRSLRFMGSLGALATNLTTDSGETIQVPANTVHGVATWVDEAAVFVEGDETFAQVNLSAFKAGTSIKVSEELLTDSAFELDSFLATEFGERIGLLEEAAYANGNGTGKPQGIVPNVTAVVAPTGQSLVFTYDSLVDVIYAVPPQYRAGSSWVIADGEAKRLRLLRTTDGYPIWATNTAVGDPDTFCGYPIYTHPDLAAPAANAKSILFGNIKRAYMVRRVNGFSLQRQGELYSNNGQVGFRGFTRVDGRVVLADAARVLQHSAT